VRCNHIIFAYYIYWNIISLYITDKSFSLIFQFQNIYMIFLAHLVKANVSFCQWLYIHRNISSPDRFPMGHFYSLRHLDISIHYVTGTFLFISSPTTNSCGDKCFILVHQLHVSVINIFSGMHHLRIGSKRVNLHNSHKSLFTDKLCIEYTSPLAQVGQYTISLFTYENIK
jgi:hypothetical protein